MAGTVSSVHKRHLKQTSPQLLDSVSKVDRQLTARTLRLLPKLLFVIKLQLLSLSAAGLMLVQVQSCLMVVFCSLPPAIGAVEELL